MENMQNELAHFAEQLVKGRVFQSEGGGKIIEIEGVNYPMHQDFQLYFLTSQKMNYFAQGFLQRVTVIDFTITEFQLMDILVRTKKNVFMKKPLTCWYVYYCS